MNIKEIDLSLVNPFLGAAYDVFKQIFDFELKKGQICIKKNPTAKFEVAIIIGISGEKHTGVVVYSMKKYTATKIVHHLVPDPELANDEQNYTDALGEMANMISGNAMTIFYTNGINLTITTPSVIIGDAFEIHLLDQTTLSTDMMSPFGVLEINVAIKKLTST